MRKDGGYSDMAVETKTLGKKNPNLLKSDSKVSPRLSVEKPLGRLFSCKQRD